MSWLDPKQMATVGRVTAVGFELVAATVVGYFLGLWLDGVLGTDFLSWVGLVLGLTAGFRSFLRLTRRLRRELDNDDDPDPPDPADRPAPTEKPPSP